MTTPIITSVIPRNAQRLSPGLRERRRATAHLAAAGRMTAQVRGLATALNNASNGLTLAQTAESALGAISGGLRRLRALAVQAGSGCTALQAEAAQRVAEIDHVARQARFNGQNLLDGSFIGAVFQTGANAGEHITLGALPDMRAARLSRVDYGITQIAITPRDEPAPAMARLRQPIAAAALTITVGNAAAALDAIDAAQSSAQRLRQVVDAINARTAATGVAACAAGGVVTLLSCALDKDRLPLEVTFSGFSACATGMDDARMHMGAASRRIRQRGVQDMDVSSPAGVWMALRKIDSAIAQTLGARAMLGAVQTRLEAAVNNIRMGMQTLCAERERIATTDFAEQTLRLARILLVHQRQARHWWPQRDRFRKMCRDCCVSALGRTPNNPPLRRARR